MELFELYSKEKAKYFVLKLLFIMVRYLLSVNRICDLLSNG